MNITGVFKELPPYAHKDELVGIDIEMYGMQEGKLHRPTGTFACMSIALERDLDAGIVYQIYDTADIKDCLDRLDWGRWVLTNAAFDIRQLRRWASIKPRWIWDTMLVEQELWGGYYSRFGLADQARRWLSVEVEKETRDLFTGGSEMTPEMVNYAALDPFLSIKIAMAQMDYIVGNDIPFDFYKQADIPMIWVTLDMIPAMVDVVRWDELAVTIDGKIQNLEAGMDFNPGSWQQIKRKIEGMTHRKLHDTQAETLEAMRLELMERDENNDAIELIQQILEAKSNRTIRSKFGRNWLEQYVEEGNTVWANWKICGATDTSRMSCDDPNLQQIPARKMPIFREMFIAPPGHKMVVADVAQQEPRILAKLSGDKELTTALQRGESPHITTGRLIFNDEKFAKADPRYYLAKAINLGMPYGLSARGVAAKTGIDITEAEHLLAIYFRRFGGVKKYMEDYRRFARQHGYVENVLGRRCWMNPYSYQLENNAINAPIQSSAGHQIKIASGALHKLCAERGIPFALSMLVHDEMVGIPKDEYVDLYTQAVQDAWKIAGEMTLGTEIPMVVEIASGDNWGCKH